MNNFKTSIRLASFLFLGILAIVIALIIFFGPLVPDDQQLKQCVVNFRLPVGGLSMNCDSPEFLRLATDPKYLFEPFNARQARPGYIGAAWLISRPFTPLTILVEKMNLQAMRQTPPRFIRPLVDYFPSYIAYVLLDIFFLWLSARLFWGIFSEDKKISLPVFIISLFFIFNGVLFYYFWSPHTQIFNIFVPIFCFWAAYKSYCGGDFWQKNVYLLSVLAGFGVVAYTTFCLFWPAIFFGEILREKKISKQSLFRLIISLLLMCIPLASWFLLVTIKNGSVYNHEAVCCGYGIWYESKNILDYFLKFLNASGGIMKNLLTKNLYIFLVGAASYFYLWRKFIEQRMVLILSASISLLFFVFFSILTFYPDRVLFAVSSLWLAPIVILLKKVNRRSAIVFSFVYLLGWVVWMFFVGIGMR